MLFMLGITVFSLCRAASFGQVDVVNYLLDNGANIEARDFSNRTPFLVAVCCTRQQGVPCARLLLSRGANIGSYEAYMKNCLHLAVENDNIYMLEMLFEDDRVLDNLYAPDVQERIPLHYAAICEDPRVMQMLSVCLSVCSSVCLSVRLSVFLSVCMFVFALTRCLDQTDFTIYFNQTNAPEPPRRGSKHSPVPGSQT